MKCVEIRCRDCDVLISTCSCTGEKTICLHQCRACEAQEAAETKASADARAAASRGARV